MIFEINFFLFAFAQSNISSYLCVYAKYYANISNTQFGVLAMLLPLLAFFAKPISCSITDAYGIHKQFLVYSLAAFGLTSGASLALLTLLKDPDDHSTDFIYWIIISILMCCGYTASSCVCSMNDALASNYARKHNKPYSRMRVWASIGWAAGAFVIMLIGDVAWLPFRAPGCILLTIAVTIDILFLLLWPYEEDFEMFHDGSTVEQRKLSIVGPNTKALLAQNKPRGSISRDMLERIRAGRSRSVGNVPRMDRGLKVLAPIELQQTKKEEKQKEYSNFKCQIILMKMIANAHKSFIRYVFLFILFGVVQGMVWSYQLDYFKERIASDKSQFEFLSTLCMVAQSVFGEILINIFATEMIRLFGANANMSLALVSIGLRCYFYSQILPYSDPLFVIIAEALQGPSLGLYWILIVDVGSNYALMVPDYMPEMKRRGIVRNRVHEEELNGCLRASMIGIMSSSMEGLGVALGSFLGGLMSSSCGYDWMWNFCAFISIIVGFANISWDIVRKLVFNSQQKGDKVAKQEDIPSILIEQTEIKL